MNSKIDYYAHVLHDFRRNRLKDTKIAQEVNLRIPEGELESLVYTNIRLPHHDPISAPSTKIELDKSRNQRVSVSQQPSKTSTAKKIEIEPAEG